jgi:aspartate aminotransferase
VIVSASAMNALMLVMQALVDPDDVVVTTTPAWPNLPAVPTILCGRIRSVPLTPANAGWRLDLERLFAACDRRTRVIFLNSPNNPTGWMMSAEEQAAVLEFARARGIWIVSDEVYARIVYDRPVAPSFLEQAAPEDRVIVVNSFSKSWAMTGWRLGWITAPAELVPSFEMLTEYNIAGPAGFIQRAGVVAVQDGEPFVSEIVARYRAARELVISRLGGIQHLSLPIPAAAFYAFVRVDGLSDSLAFAKELLQATGVGLAPGAAFGEGGEGRLRLCFAASLPTLEQALDRFAEFMATR